MAQVIIPQRWKARRGTAAALTTANEVLLAGELCFETDTGKFKIGDGSTAWTSLAYQGVWTLADVRRVLDLIGSTAEGDIIYKGASGWTRLAKGTDGQVLTLASGIPSWAAGGGGGGGGDIARIGETVLGSAATDITVSGIDLSAHRSFNVEFTLKNATGTAGDIRLLYNSDTTLANYPSQVHYTAGSTNIAVRVNAGISSLPASNAVVGDFKVKNDLDGKPRAWGHSNSQAPASVEQRVFAHVWNSATNITGITLSSSVASSIAAGSTLTVYGVN